MSPTFEFDNYLMAKLFLLSQNLKPCILTYWQFSQNLQLGLQMINFWIFLIQMIKWNPSQFWNPTQNFNLLGISWILRSQMSPHVMYGSAMCKWILRLSRGKVLHIYVGALQYTMLIFGFSFLQVLAGIKKDTMWLYLIDITLYNNYISLLLQYHKLYINTHLSV